MRLIRVPHYNQGGSSDCQAACAAMVMDYWRNRNDGGESARLGELLTKFSFGFEREAGGPYPAITGLVAKVIAEMGFTVDFHSNNPDGGGTDGLGFLTAGCWNWSANDVDRYAEHARSEMYGARDAGVNVHRGRLTAEEIEVAINDEKPVVAIIDVSVLKQGYPKSTNHAVVITGIDGEYVAIHDPAESEGHKLHNRKLFFEAHRRKETDNEAYVAVAIESQKRPYRYECWELADSTYKGPYVSIETVRAS